MIEGVGFTCLTRSRNDMETGKQNDSNANHTQEGCKSQAIKEGKETSSGSEEDWNGQELTILLENLF